MKKLLSIFALITIFSLTLFSTTACGSDDDNTTISTSLADQLVGIFVGTVRPIGYSDNPETAYITFTKMSSTAVKVKIISSAWDMDLDEIVMTISKDSNGALKLEPEKSSKNCNGTYKNGALTLTFGWSSANWLFSGEK